MAPTIEKEEIVDNVKVKKAQVAKGIKALQQVVAKRAADAGQQQLFDSDAETLSVLFTLSNISDKKELKSLKTKMIHLPHQIRDSNSEVCFISKDPQKTYKDLLLNQHPVPGLTKVIGIDKLRKNYKDPASKKTLCDAFDLFLCDIAILDMLPPLLGTHFYRKNKQPIPVVLRADPKPRIERAMQSTTLKAPSGVCVGVRFGKCSMPAEALAENANAVIAAVKKQYHGINPIQAIHIQSTDCPALPVWRRPVTDSTVKLSQYRSDNSSLASDTEGGSVIGSEDGTLESITTLSDAGETLSTRDTVSDIASFNADTVSEFSEQDSEIEESAAALHVKKGKKKGKSATEKKESPKQSPKKSPKQSPKQSIKRTSEMLPPAAPLAKKAKKAKAAA